MRRLPISLCFLLPVLFTGCGDDQPAPGVIPGGEPAAVNHVPEVVPNNLEPTAVLVMAKSGDPALYPLALEEALAALAEQNISPIGDPLGAFPELDRPAAEQHWEVLLPVPNDTLPPAGFTYRLLSKTPAAYISVKGPYALDRRPYHAALAEWVGSRGYDPQGCPLEVYHWDEALPETEWITEIYQPYTEKVQPPEPEPAAPPEPDSAAAGETAASAAASSGA